MLKSTKKLTTFKEFAITPSAKEGGSAMVRNAVFISPLKLKKLEKRHGVSLFGEGCGKEIGEEPEEATEEVTIDKEINEKNQALLKDNDAMDAYMRDLCNKYF